MTKDDFEQYKRENAERARRARDRDSIDIGSRRVPLPPAKALTGIDLIRAERSRMTTAQEYVLPIDNGHGHDLYMAALALIDYVAARASNPYAAPEQFGVPPVWPWAPERWQPDEDPIKNLTRAGALIAAAIDGLEQ